MTTASGQPTAPPHHRRPGWRTTLVVAVVVGVIIVVGVGAFTMRADNPRTDAAVRLEAADDVGDDPFTDSVAIAAAVELPGSVQTVSASLRNEMTVDKATATRVTEGTTPGLYGGSGERAVCDPAKLIQYLDGHPKKATAWASVLGIGTGDIRSFVEALTPVVLSSDTLVTNHGFRAGRANVFPAVLQSGTAVLVDARGVPRVKCNCGNPLTEPPSSSLQSTPTRGDAWQDFSVDEVVSVLPGATADSLILTDIVTAKPTKVPVGTMGTAAGAWVATALSDGGTTLFRSADGTDWKEVGSLPGEQVNGLTWDGDRWIGIARDADSTTVLASKDLLHWSEEPSIPAVIEDIEWADGTFVAVGSDGSGSDDSRGAIYTSADAKTWAPTSVTLQPTGKASMVTDVTHGPDGWVALGVSSVLADEPTRTLLTSADGTSRWESTSWSEAATWGFDGDRAAIAASHDNLAVAGEPSAEGDSALQVGPNPDALVEISTSPFEDDPPDGMAWGAAGGLAYSWGSYEPGDPITSTFVASTDGKAWAATGKIDGQVLALAWGPAGSESAEPGTTTTPSPGLDLRTIDWMNRSYALDDCPPGGVEAALEDGNWVSPDGATGIRLADVQYGELTGDAPEEAVLSFECTAVGANAYPLVVSLVFTSEGEGPSLLGDSIKGASPTIEANEVHTSDPVWADGDPRCCPSATEDRSWQYRDGSWVTS